METLTAEQRKEIERMRDERKDVERVRRHVMARGGMAAAGSGRQKHPCWAGPPVQHDCSSSFMCVYAAVPCGMRLPEGTDWLRQSQSFR